MKKVSEIIRLNKNLRKENKDNSQCNNILKKLKVEEKYLDINQNKITEKINKIQAKIDLLKNASKSTNSEIDSL